MNIQRPTKETDAAFRDGYTFCREDMRPAVEFCANLERERDEAREQLEAARSKFNFLASKGLTIGLLKSSDCPQGQLAYDIKPDSELCDLKYVHRVMELESELEALRKTLIESEAYQAGLVADIEAMREAIKETATTLESYLTLFSWPELDAPGIKETIAKIKPFLKP